LTVGKEELEDRDSILSKIHSIGQGRPVQLTPDRARRSATEGEGSNQELTIEGSW
jgi:hypothetical protein